MRIILKLTRLLHPQIDKKFHLQIALKKNLNECEKMNVASKKFKHWKHQNA